MKKDLWAIWPDDVMCPINELHEYNHKSDDFSVVEVTEYDEYGSPIKYEYLRSRVSQ